MHNHRKAGSALLFVLAAATELAHAGPDTTDADANKARREWMNKGNAEYGQKHWEAARDDYLKSWDIKHHYAIASNLADVDMKLGHYAEAAGYLKYVLGNIPDSKVADKKAAEEQLLECKKHLTVLRIATDVPDATVSIDGRNVGQTPLREELLVEPGKHLISVTKPGYGERAEELSVHGGQMDVTVALEKIALPQSSSGPAPAAAPTLVPEIHSESPKADKGSYHPISYLGFGVGAVGIGLGTYFVVKAVKTQSDSDAQYTACYPHCSFDAKGAVADLDIAARNQTIASVASYIVGGVGLATGVTFFILDRKRTSREPGAAMVRPWVGPGQAGVVGSF